ncbi:MAG: hypothetical protein ACREM8_08375, partial [Vulcanimicrobiaceae bacterium]
MVAVALIVPLLLAAGALLVQQQVALRLTQREIVGLGYLDRGYAVLDGLESYAETAGERPADRDRAAAAVDDRLDTLEKYAAQSAARVDLRKDVAAIRADWRTAKQPGASEQSLNRTIDRGVLLCFRLGDHAGYFADASPTVATLSDVVVAEYAGVAAKIGHSATILERAARRGRLTYDDRFDATTYESQARFEFEAARGDLDSLATWRPGLRPQLPGLLAGVRKSVFAFAGPINHDVIRAENPRFARSTFSRASAHVRESVADAERNVTALLRSDLETRATRIIRTIALIAIATFAAIAVAVYLLRALTLVFVRRERHTLAVAAAEAERSRLAFEHDRAIDAMVSTEARFRAIFNGSTVGMAIIDLDGCTLEQNETLSRTFGRFDVRTLGYDERELHAVLSGRCERIVCEVAVGNGRADRRWLSANLSLVRDDDQRARFAMAIFQDVTERR